MSGAPSAWKIEQAMAAWQSTRARLLHEDPSLEGDEAALAEVLGPVDGDIDTILARVLRAKVHAESMKDAAKARRVSIAEREKRYENRETTLRGLAYAIMDTMGKRKVELGDLTANIRSGKKSVMITDIQKVPDVYVETVTERKPDKATMLADLEAGRTIDGAELSNGLDYIVIKKG